MKLAFTYAALLATFMAIPIGARAEEEPAMKVIHEITLDIDHDGRTDRAALVKREVGTAADLLIYLAAGEQRLDLSRSPTVLKKGLANGHVMALERNARGSLLVNFGCGGCSNDVETKLTIVHRHGDFWVAGFSYGWETRDWGSGSCDINFLTGKGVRSLELAKSKPIQARFSRLRLADWSDERQQNLLQRYCFKGS
jgi:hypothetical protein